MSHLKPISTRQAGPEVGRDIEVLYREVNRLSALANTTKTAVEDVSRVVVFPSPPATQAEDEGFAKIFMFMG